MKLRKYIVALVITGVAISLASAVTAAEKVVVVPLFDSSPTCVAAIPVYCLEAELPNTGASILLDCFRSDTRTSVTPVPAGHFLFITDILTNRNSLATSGRAFIVIGRNNGGTIGIPRYNFSISDIRYQ
jgi:hypothetical protein